MDDCGAAREAAAAAAAATLGDHARWAVAAAEEAEEAAAVRRLPHRLCSGFWIERVLCPAYRVAAEPPLHKRKPTTSACSRSKRTNVRRARWSDEATVACWRDGAGGGEGGGGGDVVAAGESEQRVTSGAPAAAGGGVPSSPGGHVLTDGRGAGRSCPARYFPPRRCFGNCDGRCLGPKVYGHVFHWPPRYHRTPQHTLLLHWGTRCGPKVRLSWIWAIDVERAAR